MKKVSSFLLAGLVTATLTACSQETVNAPILQTSQPSNVSTYSAEGLNSMMNLIIQDVFKQIDRNKDKYVSLEEYRTAMTPSQPVQPAPGDPMGSPPSEQPGNSPADQSIAQTSDQVATQISAQSAKASIPTDPTARFKKMDKNKDGKLSSTEVKNASVYFIPSQRQALKNMAKMFFDLADTDKNKVVSRDEFMAINLVPDSAGKMVQGTLFLYADRNKNGSLGISEFEDIHFNAIKTLYAGTTPTPAPLPPSEPIAPPSEQPAPPAEPTQP